MNMLCSGRWQDQTYPQQLSRGNKTSAWVCEVRQIGKRNCCACKKVLAGCFTQATRFVLRWANRKNKNNLEFQNMCIVQNYLMKRNYFLISYMTLESYLQVHNKRTTESKHSICTSIAIWRCFHRMATNVWNNVFKLIAIVEIYPIAIIETRI